MKIRVVSLKNGIISGVFLFIVLFIPNRILAYDFSDWSHGASGYNDAIQEAINKDKPLILYFNTDWCKWCKKMNSDYLASYAVKQFLSDIPKVEINPDKGAAEKALTNKYRVTGYPSFLVFIPSISSKTERIYPFRKGTDWTIDEFLHAIRERIAYQYNNKGHSCFQRKNYEDALKYLNTAIDFNSENAFSYYLKGRIKYTIGHRDKDSALLEEAEENYLKALELEPNNQDIKRDLEQLHKLMEYLGIR